MFYCVFHAPFESGTSHQILCGKTWSELPSCQECDVRPYQNSHLWVMDLNYWTSEYIFCFQEFNEHLESLGHGKLFMLAALKDNQCVCHHSCFSNTKSSGATGQCPVSLGANHQLQYSPLVLRVLTQDLQISALVVEPASPRAACRKVYPNLYLDLTFPREACFHPNWATSL